MQRTVVAAWCGANRETRGRPRRRAFSARRPTRSTRPIQRLTVPRATPKTRAASFAKDLSQRPGPLAGEGPLGLLPAENVHPVFPCQTHYHIYSLNVTYIMLLLVTKLPT